MRVTKKWWEQAILYFPWLRKAVWQDEKRGSNMIREGVGMGGEYLDYEIKTRPKCQASRFEKFGLELHYVIVNIILPQASMRCTN